MTQRNPIEKDILVNLQDLRHLIANLIRSISAYNEETQITINALIVSLDKERTDRRLLEAEEAKHNYESKARMVNGNSTTEKIRAKVTKEVETQLNAKSIPWAKIFREKVIPTALTTVTVIIILATLTLAMPHIVIPILQKAFPP